MKTSESGRGCMLFYRSFAVPRTEDTRVPRLPTKRGSLRCQLYVFLILLALIYLRDISLARAEYEVGHELVLRLPRVQRNIAEFLVAPKEETRGLDSSDSQASIATDAVR
jgi:hypothetical protein